MPSSSRAASRPAALAEAPSSLQSGPQPAEKVVACEEAIHRAGTTMGQPPSQRRSLLAPTTAEAAAAAAAVQGSAPLKLPLTCWMSLQACCWRLVEDLTWKRSSNWWGRGHSIEGRGCPRAAANRCQPHCS